MTLSFFWGCMLVAFGPPFVLFMRLVSNRPQLVIVCISAAFFWLLGLMIGAILWFVVPPLQSSYIYVPFTVLCIELFRSLFFHTYKKAEENFSVISTNAVVFPLSDISSATASGLGFGVMHAMMLYGSIISNSTGPGTLYSLSCPHVSTFVVSAFLSLAFTLLHVFLMIIAFDGYRRGSVATFFLVMLGHSSAALTIFNSKEDGCYISLPLVYVTVFVYMVYAAWVTHREGYRSKKF